MHNRPFQILNFEIHKPPRLLWALMRRSGYTLLLWVLVETAQGQTFGFCGRFRTAFACIV